MRLTRMIVSAGSIALVSLALAATGGSVTATAYPVAPFGVTHGKGGNLADVDGLSSTDMWAVGSYDPRGGGRHGLVEHWNGSKWSIGTVPTVGNADNLSAVSVVSSTDVWAVGRSYDNYDHMATLVHHWDGAAWTHVPSPTPPGDDGGGAEFNDVVALSDSDVWAVGSMDPQTLEWRQRLIEHWNGVRWKQLACPHPGVPTGASLSSLSFTSPSDGWAVGYYEQNYGKHLAFIEHWNGKTWSWMDSHVKLGKYWKNLNTVKAISPDDVWAAGGHDLGTLMEHWDGQSWTIVDDPSPGTWSEISGIDATSANDVWAVGAYTGHRGMDRTLVEHWDGSTWTQLPPSHAPGRESWLSGVRALTDHDVWMVGSMSRQTPLSHDRELSGHWDGSAWRWF